MFRALSMSIQRPQQEEQPRANTSRIALATCAALLFFTASTVNSPRLYAGEIELTNGFRIEGSPFRIQGLTTKVVKTSGTNSSYPIWAIEDGYRRYFISRTLVKGGFGTVVATKDSQRYIPPSGVKMDKDLSRYEKFQLPQQKKNRRKTPSVIGTVTVDTDFTEHGRRIVNLAGVKQPVIQGITEISPQFVKVEGLNLHWEFGLATTSIPPDTLHAMILNAIDQSDLRDRLAVVKFYAAAQMLGKARTELTLLLEQHPDLTDYKPVENIIHQQEAIVLLAELVRRQKAGQHLLAMNAAKQFPLDNLGAEAAAKVRDLLNEYETKQHTIETVLSRLSDLQSQLPEGTLKDRVAAARIELRDKIEFNSIDRFAPFMNLEGLKVEQQLALAFSGWLLGSANAIDDLRETLNLWDAQFLILEIIRTDVEVTRQELTQDLIELEGVGLKRVQQLVPHLPPLIESVGVEAGKPLTFNIPGHGDQESAAYTIILPPEYSPNRVYPTIVTLRSQGRSIENQLSFWAGTAEQAGQAQRHGYIVIAPHYVDEKHPKYEHDARAHQVILDSLVDAKKRFQIDSDRIFLTGHGMGGDAAIDLGMARPHEFAGVLPIAGLVSDISNWYWKNSAGLAWYVVAGELDRQSMEHNAAVFNNMMRKRHNLVYVEYIGRGYEHYYEEIHRMFEWMSYQKRSAWPSEIDMNIKRPRDNSFYWVQAHGLPTNVVGPAAKGRKMAFHVRMSDGNTMRITSGADYHDIFLSPDIVDFDKKLTVSKGSRKKFHGFLSPSVADMLEGLRENGDRQQLRWQRLRIK